MSSFEKKLEISISSSIIFLIINSPATYKLTSKLTNLNLFDFSSNCRTNLGILTHTLLFFIITFLTMKNSNIDFGIKLKHSIYATLIFYFISSPSIFSIINNLTNINNDCISNIGTVIHSIIYCLSLIAIMYLPN